MLHSTVRLTLLDVGLVWLPRSVGVRAGACHPRRGRQAAPRGEEPATSSRTSPAASNAPCISSRRRPSSSSAAKGSIRSWARSRLEAASPTAPAIAIAICSTTRARWICGPRRASAGTGPPRRASRFRNWRTSVSWSRPGPPTATTRRRTSSASVPTRRAPTRPATPSGRTSSARASACARFRSCWWAAASSI